MRYVLIEPRNKVTKERDIRYWEVVQLVASEANGDRLIMLDNLTALRKFGWITSKKGGEWVIEHRAN